MKLLNNESERAGINFKLVFISGLLSALIVSVIASRGKKLLKLSIIGGTTLLKQSKTMIHTLRVYLVTDIID